MKKIPLKDIDSEVLSFRGIDRNGCIRTECDDECCKFGADVDKESYDLILKHRELIEEAIGFRIEKCFKKRWMDDSHYLGGNAVESGWVHAGSACSTLQKAKAVCFISWAMRKIYQEG